MAYLRTEFSDTFTIPKNKGQPNFKKSRAIDLADFMGSPSSVDL